MCETADVESGKAAFDASGKTPVSLLQEIAAMDGVIPTYNLVQTDSTTNEPAFKYRVDVKSTSAIGCGPSKKRAKHAAATAVLLKLQNNVKRGKEQDFAVLASLDLSADSEFVAEMEAESTANHVGDLLQFCVNLRLKPPIYEADDRNGQNRKFAVTCTVDAQSVTGEGTSKKAAKRESSRLMLHKLREAYAALYAASSGTTASLLSASTSADAMPLDSAGAIERHMFAAEQRLAAAECPLLGRLRQKQKNKPHSQQHLQQASADDNELTLYPPHSYLTLTAAIGNRQRVVVESRPITIKSPPGVDDDDAPADGDVASSPSAVETGTAEDSADHTTATVRDVTIEDEIRDMIEAALVKDNADVSQDTANSQIGHPATAAAATCINVEAVSSILLDERGKDGQFMAVVQMPIDTYASAAWSTAPPPPLIGCGAGATADEAQFAAARQLIDIVREIRDFVV